MDSSSAPDNWPASGLEKLGACPVCGAPQRELVHEGLTDITFGAAPGKWSLWRCADCRSGYLDPRPNRETIGLAYSAYYTHESAPDLSLTSSYVSRVKNAIKQGLLNDYLNRERGYKLPNAIPFSGAFLRRKPVFRFVWDYVTRHLPAPVRSDATLLDIGCGSGEFLNVALRLGYEPYGLEPDPAAVAVATSHGLSVREGGLPSTGYPDSSYDIVTISHVIEHVHDPKIALAEIFRILRPGGKVWMIYPNIDSLGHRHFGPFWRGLEAPRHLSLMPESAMTRVLRDIGFVEVNFRGPEPSAKSYFQRSAAMQAGLNQFDNSQWNDELEQISVAANKKSLEQHHLAENITIMATKPNA